MLDLRRFYTGFTHTFYVGRNHAGGATRRLRHVTKGTPYAPKNNTRLRNSRRHFSYIQRSALILGAWKSAVAISNLIEARNFVISRDSRNTKIFDIDPTLIIHFGGIPSFSIASPSLSNAISRMFESRMT